MSSTWMLQDSLRVQVHCALRTKQTSSFGGLNENCRIFPFFFFLHVTIGVCIKWKLQMQQSDSETERVWSLHTAQCYMLLLLCTQHTALLHIYTFP